MCVVSRLIILVFIYRVDLFRNKLWTLIEIKDGYLLIIKGGVLNKKYN